MLLLLLSGVLSSESYVREDVKKAIVTFEDNVEYIN